MKPPSQPHVLTALLLSLIESKRKVPASGNIRAVLSPMQIVDTVHASAGFKLLIAEVRESNEGLLDGFWEVGDLLRKRGRVLGELKGEGENGGVGEKELSALMGMYDAVQANVDGLESGVSGVRSMDVWVGKFDVIRGDLRKESGRQVVGISFVGYRKIS
jgi:hypothetical protein